MCVLWYFSWKLSSFDKNMQNPSQNTTHLVHTYHTFCVMCEDLRFASDLTLSCIFVHMIDIFVHPWIDPATVFMIFGDFDRNCVLFMHFVVFFYKSYNFWRKPAKNITKHHSFSTCVSHILRHVWRFLIFATNLTFSCVFVHFSAHDLYFRSCVNWPCYRI